MPAWLLLDALHRLHGYTTSGWPFGVSKPRSEGRPDSAYSLLAIAAAVATGDSGEVRRPALVCVAAVDIGVSECQTRLQFTRVVENVETAVS